MQQVDLTGKRFKFVTVIRLSSCRQNNKIHWDCRCDCGEEWTVRGSALTSGNTTRCRQCACQAIGKKVWKGTGKLSGSFWCRLKANATNRGYKVKISQQDAYNLFVAQKGICNLSGLPIAFEDMTASLDRIDSSKDYVQGNVQWVHKDINRMKNTFTEHRFVELATRIANFRGMNNPRS